MKGNFEKKTAPCFSTEKKTIVLFDNKIEYAINYITIALQMAFVRISIECIIVHFQTFLLFLHFVRARVFVARVYVATREFYAHIMRSD